MASLLLVHPDDKPDERYVFKKIVSHYRQDANFVRMFRREAEIGMRLRHQNLVRTVQVGSHLDDLFIVLEYVQGLNLKETLHQLRQQGRELSKAARLYLLLNIAQGLDHLHRGITHDHKMPPIVHRDISPHNIMISHRGEVKIIDFGISKAIRTDHDSTVAGSLKGKISYMSPEQARGQEVTTASDLFALGILAFELFSGRRMYPDMEHMRILNVITQWKASSLQETLSGLSGFEHHLVESLLQPQARDRLPAFEVVKGVRAQLASLSPQYGPTVLAKELSSVMSGPTEKVKLETKPAPTTPVIDLYSMLTEKEDRPLLKLHEAAGAVVLVVLGTLIYQKLQAPRDVPLRREAASIAPEAPRMVKFKIQINRDPNYLVEVNGRRLSQLEKSEGFMVDPLQPLKISVYNPKKRKWSHRTLDLRKPASRLEFED